ncbi:hypothetical protein IscW_ISCW010870 [Ixodes scapularis]|uniref:Uncharacterized protein n=1 Tax=Ixodes scapularis TaxID=6945 RepID=B7Q8J1_IXOSC|nr:hypothetical protein IscW_ISCW010870 [Ixodes scapularis]|eukprot:XP_002405165.1 hypothetical protein IscW_ISCW010870 [Ixodes scapularis]
MCYILYSGFHCITKKIKNISVKQVPVMCSQLIGVHLVGEVDLNRTNTRSDVVGVLRLPKADASLVEVRGLISSELAAFRHDFVFLTQENTGFTLQDDSKKDIVISYARSEADEHARKLKESLESLGAKVFLVKLADYIGKFVIPVNFLRTWPPNHLAIQFASIQYIDWRKPSEVQQGSRESDGEEEESLRVWEKRSVERVASDIFSSLRQCREEFPYPHSFSVSLLLAQKASR